MSNLIARRGAIANSRVTASAPAPTYTDLGGGPLSGANSSSHTFSFTTGNTFVYMVGGFFDSTGPGTLQIDGGATRLPTCQAYSAVGGTSNQSFTAIWIVTGLSTGSHTLAWNGNAATLESYGTISGVVATVVNFTASSASGGSTLTASNTLTGNALILATATCRSLTATIPSSADAGSTTIRSTGALPAPNLHWQESLAAGAASIVANIQASKPQALAAVGVSN